MKASHANQQTKIFFELLQSGLWEGNTHLSSFNGIDYQFILSIAEEQSVVGLITAGLEAAQEKKIPQSVVLQFVGNTLQIEEQNKAMNQFIARLVQRLGDNEVYALLVKGQGIAQCYNKPLWRACGDVDILLSDDNYQRAKMF